MLYECNLLMNLPSSNSKWPFIHFSQCTEFMCCGKLCVHSIIKNKYSIAVHSGVNIVSTFESSICIMCSTWVLIRVRTMKWLLMHLFNAPFRKLTILQWYKHATQTSTWTPCKCILKMCSSVTWTIEIPYINFSYLLLHMHGFLFNNEIVYICFF